MSDERQNLPSASMIHRLKACPACLRTCRGLSDRPSDDSNFGDAIHAHLAGKITASALTPEQLDMAESCQAIEAKLLKQWTLRNSIPEEEMTVTRDSERLWLHVKGSPACSGVADVVYHWDDRALVLDFKTLPGDHAESDANLQLRTLAVLLGTRHHNLQAVDVAIIQPLVTHSPEVTHYDAEALALAHAELRGILDAAQKPDAPLITGDHCKFCAANLNAVCPAVHATVKTLATLTIHEAGLTVSDEDLAALRAKTGAAKKMCASIEAEAFRRAQENPEAWRSLGYEITEGTGRGAVDDVATVGERLHERGVSWPEITAKCNISIKSCEELVRAATKAKGMGLKKEMESILADCVKVKTAKPSLKRIGQPEEDES